MPTGHKWSPIADLTDPSTLSDGELTALLEVWKDQRAALKDDSGLVEFAQRLNREWAIETGIIERAYTLDRGTTETLIKEGIKASLITRDSTNRDPEELATILQDHLDALEGLFAFVKGERELSTGYVNEMHATLLRHVPTHRVHDANGNFFDTELIRGAYKTLPNSPTRGDGSVHEYCPPEHVASEMDRLIELHREHAQKNVLPEVEAAWLHHAFTQIHPYADGNGRVARMLASLVFVKAGGFPLIIRRDDQANYIEALEMADRGDLKPLVTFFVRAQRRAVLGALQALPDTVLPIQDPIEQPHSPEDVIAGVRDLLVKKETAGLIPTHWDSTANIWKNLAKVAETRFKQLANKLQVEIGQYIPGFAFDAYPAGRPDPTWESTRATASKFGYEALARRGHTSLWLTMKTKEAATIVLSIHELGREYRGVMACLLILHLSTGQALRGDDFFQFNYKDVPVEAEARFKIWLEKGLTRALELWREQL